MSYFKPTLHMIGLFHTIPNHHYDHCAFTGKVLRFAKMMQAQGYKVIEYSNGKSISGADEQVQIYTEEEVAEYTKTVDNFMKLAAMGTPMWQNFQDRLVPELAKRIKKYDIVCHPFGTSHSILVSRFPEAYHVETGIGYDTGDFGAFRVFESYAWMHYHQGKDQIKNDKGEVIQQGRRGKFYEWVVPNYYNGNDWEPNYEKGDYILYLGRIFEGKGLYVIQEISKHFKEKIKIVGMGDPTPFQAPNMEFLGPIVGQKERSDLLRNARVVIMPTLYTEPFGGVAVEAMMCGTPVVTTDYGVFPETIEHGKTGFRCHTLGDFLAGIVAAETLDRRYIADRARRLYSTEAVGKQYDIIFKQISELQGPGWYSLESHYIKEPALIWEQRWWGDCKDTREEEEKQKAYAKFMGLGVDKNAIYFNPPYVMRQKVIDIGGGPVSMLLKMAEGEIRDCKVYDPSSYPEWTMERYKEHGIEYIKKGGEEVNEKGYDEVWIYNCLQHTQDPEKIIQNAKRAGKRLRIFEWLAPSGIGHPQALTKENLDKWIGQKGNVVYLNEGLLYGSAYYGVFEFKN
jgi:glycosyltransferase involved in cell wall biosynthesis